MCTIYSFQKDVHININKPLIELKIQSEPEQHALAKLGYKIKVPWTRRFVIWVAKLRDIEIEHPWGI